MSREIKFRMWSPGNMIYDVDNVMECLKQQVAFNNGFTKFPIPYDHVGLHDSVFMQYTGLKDKNGKEIYEGDLVSYVLYTGEETEESGVAEVVFDKGSFYVDEWFLITVDEIKIIGNVYQNPELIKP